MEANLFQEGNISSNNEHTNQTVRGKLQYISCNNWEFFRTLKYFISYAYIDRIGKIRTSEHRISGNFHCHFLKINAQMREYSFQENIIWFCKLASFSKQFVLQPFRKRGFKLAMTLSVKVLSASSHTNFQMEFSRSRRKKALNPWIPAMRAAQSSTSTRLRRLVGEPRQLVVHRQWPHLPAPPSPLISPQVLAQLWGLQGSCSKCRAGPSGVVTTSPRT